MTERDLFLSALDRPAADRPAYLDRACAGNPDLRRKVGELLAAHAEAGSFLEPDPDRPPPSVGDVPTGWIGVTAGPAGDAAAPGTVLGGRYKLLEPIGEGGMGAVWVAEQTAPVRRKVAVKLIRPGMGSKAVLARFEAERQALAVMDHPNIARVFDAGATPDGRPYFVMELVKGVPITRSCDDRKLTPRERLELLIPVCQAVQHAHQKGVIHRDIKPANVLVALYDDKPVPKVIDFGIAKATDEPLTEATLHTGFGAVVGTPEYMSPEQASFNQLDVDTRSDVYALGVLLYELLTGSPPHRRAELQQAGLLEVLRVIREEEPPPPSDRVTTAEGRAAVAAARGTDPGRLAGQVRGELDWIVMKALEKDRDRRYESAAALAADVRRHLAGEAVQAAPPSLLYRYRKFVRRNPKFVSVATGVIVGLMIGSFYLTQQWLTRRAQERADEAAEKSRGTAAAAEGRAYLLASVNGELLRAAGEFTAAAGPDARRAAADRLARIGDRFAAGGSEDAPTRARVLSDLGRAVLDLGSPDRAAGLLAAAARLDPVGPQWVGGGQPQPESTAGAAARAYLVAGRPAEAAAVVRERVAAVRAGWPDGLPGALTEAADVFIRAGAAGEAVGLLRECVAAEEARVPPGGEGTRARLGRALVAAGRAAEAEPVLRACLARDEGRRAGSWEEAEARSVLGGAVLALGRLAEAEPLLTAGYRQMTGRRSADPSPEEVERTAAAADRLVELYQKLGKPDEVRKWRTERAQYPPFVAPPPREVRR